MFHAHYDLSMGFGHYGSNLFVFGNVAIKEDSRTIFHIRQFEVFFVFALSML